MVNILKLLEMVQLQKSFWILAIINNCLNHLQQVVDNYAMNQVAGKDILEEQETDPVVVGSSGGQSEHGPTSCHNTPFLAPGDQVLILADFINAGGGLRWYLVAPAWWRCMVGISIIPVDLLDMDPHHKYSGGITGGGAESIMEVLVAWRWC